jgi:hypothetical protein
MEQHHALPERSRPATYNNPGGHGRPLWRGEHGPRDSAGRAAPLRRLLRVKSNKTQSEQNESALSLKADVRMDICDFAGVGLPAVSGGAIQLFEHPAFSMSPPDVRSLTKLCTFKKNSSWRDGDPCMYTRLTYLPKSPKFDSVIAAARECVRAWIGARALRSASLKLEAYTTRCVMFGRLRF